MHREFETYVHHKDEADTAEKTKEALLHVTGKSTLCMPLIKRTACTGVTQSMNNIREQRELSHTNFEDDNEALRDAMYERSAQSNWPWQNCEEHRASIPCQPCE